MRVVLDIRYRTRSGASSYIENLVPRLLISKTEHEFILLHFAGQPLPVSAECETIPVRMPSAAHQVAWDQLFLPAVLRGRGAGIYHAMKTLGTIRPPCLQVTVGHSITVPYRGEFFPASSRQSLYWNTLGTFLFRRSAAVIAVSKFVAEFLSVRLGVRPERIHVVYHGIDDVFSGAPPHPGGRVSTPPYLLVAGNIFPVKNAMTAVLCFAEVAAAHPELRLKLAGRTDHPYCESVRDEARRAGVIDRVDFLGVVARKELMELMRRAELFLLPSLTEGFAFTLLEAMACELPVVASSRGAIPEVGGDAVTLVQDPRDVRGFADAVRRLLADPASRARLAKAGSRRVQRFSWTAATEGTLAVYDHLAREAAGK